MTHDMKFLFVMDPAEGMLPDKDTSFLFMLAAGARGHQCYHSAPEDLSAGTGEDGRAAVDVLTRTITVQRSAPHVTLGASERVRAADFHAILIRKDPPFDTAYLHLTQVLDLVKDRALVVNDPAGLRAANEKLFALRFPEWMPRTLVTREPTRIHEFLEEVGGKAVLKPLDGAGGSGVVLLTRGDKNNRALADLHTREGKEPAMVQEFQPSIALGDKRVLLLAGQPLGVIRRVPRSDDIRANIHVGGRVELASLTEREEALVRAISPALVAHGLWFVGLDLIDERLIEVNVTSPTGMQELGHLSGTDPAARVIEWIEVESARLRAGGRA